MKLLSLTHLSRSIPLLQLPKQDYHWRIPMILALALAPLAYINMSMFHMLSELFAIGIAVMSFVVSWHTFPYIQNRFLLFLGCAYFWVGVIDLTHTLTFKNILGMDNITAGTTIQLWINARFLEASALLLASFSFYRHASPKKIFLTFGLIAAISTAFVFLHWLPDMFVPGKGLTSIKIYSEYTIIAILLLAAITIKILHPHIERSIRNLIWLSIALTIIAELAFTLYAGLNELPVILGHLFKLFSFWAIYCALIESALKRPFHSLSQVVHSYDAGTDETVIIDEEGLIQHANQAVIDAHSEDIVGRHCHNYLHPQSLNQNECPLCLAIRDKNSLHNHEYEDPISKKWYEANLSPIHASEMLYVMVHSIRDISTRKRAEEQFNSLNRLYKVLSRTNRAIVQTHDEDTLFQSMCDIAIEFGSFKMVWIGQIDGVVVKPRYFAGAESGYLREMQMRIDDSDWAQGPVGISAKTLDVACVNSVSRDPNFAPWREAAIQRGYGSLAAVPLIKNQKPVGIFTLYSEHENVFDEDMLQLLRSLSKDISAALFNLDQAEQKRHADATILRLSQALEQSANAVVITNTKGIIEYVNSGFSELTGYTASEALNQDVFSFAYYSQEDKSYAEISNTLKERKSWQGKIKSRKKNGDSYWMMQTISPIKNEQDNITHYVSTASDLTKLHEAQETIEQLAFYDPLTGLANRRLLMDRMVHDLASARRHKELLAIVLCDLDNFKNINDSLGHEQGDELLKHVASVLSAQIHEEDTAGRLGGDEFVLILSGDSEVQRVTEAATQILKALEKPVHLSGNQVAISSSIGIALYPQDGTTTNELFRNADLAMYHAKELGKNQFQFFQEEMNEKAQTRLALEQKLRTAIEQQAFELYYQPQVDLDTQNIIGFEALIRWRDSELGFITPDQFIPLAEETGLIEPIGDWVIDQAFKDWNQIINKGMPNTKMSVNVAAYQFKNTDHLAERIQQKLEMHTACRAEQFTLELTESTLVDNIEATATALTKLKQQGVSISIDDFGTGYSSLNYLKRFPIDQLKIDRSFIQDLLRDKNDEAITDAVITLAEKLELNVIAEGIEEQEQSKALLAKGCQFGQGYYYYKPMPISDVFKLLD